MSATALLVQRVRRTSGAARMTDERQLALVYQRDPGSRQQVVEALMPLARSTLHPYAHVREPREDLEQVAMVGLIKALRGFDPARCGSFAAYAYPTIRGELRRHFRDTGWAVHVPREAKQLAVAIGRLEREAGEPLPDETVARRLGVDVDRVRAAQRARLAMMTEPMPHDDGEHDRHAGRAGSEDPGYARVEDRVTVRELLRELPPEARLMMSLRYDAGLSQRRIGEVMGMSQMQVCRRLRSTVDGLGGTVARQADDARVRDA